MFRNSSTYVSVAVFVGLFCYVAFVDKKIPGTQQVEDANTHVFELNPDDVTSLEISNLHGFFFFQKVDHHWEVRKPVETPADGATVDGLINQIVFTQPQRVIQVDGGSADDIDNLKKWGLDPAAERVVIHTKDKEYELLVGRKMAINDSVYARASGRKNEPVRIIPSTVKDALEKDLSDFRSRNVFDFNRDNVTQISSHIADTPTTPGQQCEIDRKNGHWGLQLPLVARASDADVDALVAKILGLHVIDFVVDDASNLSTYGLASPTSTLSVALTGAEPMVLEIGGPVPNKPDQVYAQRLKSNSVFTLAKADVTEVLKALPNVRDRHILPFDTLKATGVRFSLGAKKGEVRADHALWATVGDAAGPADLTKCTDLLANLTNLETTPVLKDSATDLKPFGLDKPQGKIVVTSPEFSPSGTASLFIGKDENKLLYVRNSTEPFIYTVPDNTFDFLPASNLALRDARVINLKREEVKALIVTAGTAPPVKLSRSVGGTWTATNVKDRMVDSMKADTQAALLCQLQAKSWLGPALPAYGLAKPVLSFEVDADKIAVLHIGAPLPDGSHAAQVEGDPTVFALADGDFGILNSSSLQVIPQQLPPGTLPATNVPAAMMPKTNSVTAGK